MNKFIKEQLNKCNIELPSWDESTTQLIIPSYSEHIDRGYKNNPEYDIYIQNYVIMEPPDFTLSHQWNNDTVPPENKMHVKIVDTRGKMTKVAGRGITTNIPWEGWLPNKSFNVI